MSGFCRDCLADIGDGAMRRHADAPASRGISKLPLCRSPASITMRSMPLRKSVIARRDAISP
jgi:hypothetical protein